MVQTLKKKLNYITSLVFYITETRKLINFALKQNLLLIQDTCVCCNRHIIENIISYNSNGEGITKKELKIPKKKMFDENKINYYQSEINLKEVIQTQKLRTVDELP